MDEEKKKKLADMDDAWDFEAKTELPQGIDWENILEAYNFFQEKYMRVWIQITGTNFSKWKWLVHKLKCWMGWETVPDEAFKTAQVQTVTFHNRKVYRFFQQLALALDWSLEDAVWMAVSCPGAVCRRFDVDKSRTIHVDLQDLEGGSDKGVSEENLDDVKEELEAFKK